MDTGSVFRSSEPRKIPWRTLTRLARVSAVMAMLCGISSALVPRVHAGTDLPPTSFYVSSELISALTKALSATGLTAAVTIPGFPLPDGRVAPASMQTFPLWHDNAEIGIPAGNGWAGKGRPRYRAQLLGRLLDKRATSVQLRQTSTGMTGFVLYDGRLVRLSFAGYRVTFELMGTASTASGSVCAVGETPRETGTGILPKPVGPPGETLNEFLATLDPISPPQITDALSTGFCCVSVPGGQSLKFYDVAVETDDEMMVRFNGSSSAVQRHVTDLIAAVNTLYWDANSSVLFRLRWFHIYQAGANGAAPDIFSDLNSNVRVLEIQNLWNTNPDRIHKTTINRDIGLLLSGTHLGGSSIAPPWECISNGVPTGQACYLNLPQQCSRGGTCGWVGESVCKKDKAYAAVSFYDAVANPVATQIQDTAHELGHLFGAEHAQCVDTLVPATVPPTDPIDRCRSGVQNMRGQACWAGPARGPLNNLATVMSICGGLFPNIQAGGFHAVSGQNIRNAALTGACGKPATVSFIHNGIPVHNLQSRSTAMRSYFAIDVPSGQSALDISTRGAGELYLYARHGTLPTRWGTVKAELPGTANQDIHIANPQAGRFYILLWGWNPFSGVTLSAQFR